MAAAARKGRLTIPQAPGSLGSKSQLRLGPALECDVMASPFGISFRDLDGELLLPRASNAPVGDLPSYRRHGLSKAKGRILQRGRVGIMIADPRSLIFRSGVCKER